MPLLLQIESGPRRGERVALELRQPVSVGRTGRSTLALSDDTFLSGRHFQVEAVEDGCNLLDLNSSNGTLLRGTRVTSAYLRPGDTFTAGQTLFRVVLEKDQSADEPAPAAAAGPHALLPASRARLLQEMRTSFQPLYAVLDAARDPRILATLLEHKCQYAWLFEQGTPPELVSFAPYLVPLTADSAALEPLLEAGWTDHWGVYLSSSASAWDLLAFLRRLLLADQPDGQRALLRFYDPRVLRTLLDHSVERQWPFLFGVVQQYLLPGEQSQTSIRFAPVRSGLERSSTFLDGSAEARRELVTGAPSTRESRGAGGNHRLLLTTQQMEHFQNKKRDPLLDKLMEEIPKKHPDRLVELGEPGMADWVKFGRGRPSRYGLQTDGDVAAYVSLMMQLGRNFDEDLPWAKRLLHLRLRPAEKLARLSAGAVEHLAQAPASA